MSEQLTQLDLFKVMMDNATNNQLVLTSISSSTEVSAGVCGDHQGNLYQLPLIADTVEIEIRLTMRKKVFLEINELLSKVIRS